MSSTPETTVVAALVVGHQQVGLPDRCIPSGYPTRKVRAAVCTSLHFDLQTSGRTRVLRGRRRWSNAGALGDERPAQ